MNWDWLSDIPTAIWGGLIGAAIAQLLTWLRERRRNRDQYRAPQRDAIAALMVAHNELKIAVADFTDIMKPTGMSEEEQNRVLNAFIRGLMETDRAFSVCRLVVSEPACRTKLNEARERYDRLAQILNTPAAASAIAAGGPPFFEFLREVMSRSNALDKDRIDLVGIAEKRLGSVPPLSSVVRHWLSLRRGPAASGLSPDELPDCGAAESPS